MKNFFIIFVIVMLALTSLPTKSEEKKGYSGMVHIEKDIYLAVKDNKNSNIPKYNQHGPRVTIIRITAGKDPHHESVEVDDWKDNDGVPSDLEAVCSIPGRPYEFLLAESGFFDNKFGRIFHVQLAQQNQSWRLKVLGVMRIYKRALDNRSRTVKANEVEGVSCFRDAENRLILVYAERGGLIGNSQQVGRILWGEFDLNKYEFKQSGDEALVSSSVLNDRDCSDLFIQVGNESHLVWSVATIDAGDNGPFRSVIFRAGTFIFDHATNTLQFKREPRPIIHWQLDGLKVEALAAPTPVVPRSGFSIGTDDECYGGIWRPLFE